MKSILPTKTLAAAVLLLSLAGCRNDGVGPVVTDERSATSGVPGSGAGNSATGATGGSATSPGSTAGTTAGVTGPQSSTAVGGTGRNADTASGVSGDPTSQSRPNERVPVPPTR
jgi:hypothetical protein